MTDSVFASRNPYTGQFDERFEPLRTAEVETALRDAVLAQRHWARAELDDRVAVMSAAADALEARADELASALAAEMGKPLEQGRAEVAKSAALCRRCGTTAASALDPRDRVAELDAHVRVDPIGLVLGVMPWNFPIWQTLRFTVPSLLLGNGVILKPAPNVVRTSRALADVLRTAGLPAGVFQTMLLGESRTLELIRDDPRIAAVTLTGSGRAGRAVAAAAGAGLKKSVLELGGSDPFIVLADADIEAAAIAAAASRTQNAGQSCIAAKRFIVDRRVVDTFVPALVTAMSRVEAGDPFAAGTAMGPLARADVRDRLHEQVLESVRQGARLLLGGQRPEGNGYAYPATVLADVGVGTRVWREETFGPVAAVRTAADDDDALELANATRFGLGASVWTGDSERAQAFAAQLHSGMVTVNDMVRSDARITFGGVKESGHGRELGSWGWYEFANIKAVRLAG